MSHIGIIGSLVVDYLCNYVDKMPALGEHIMFDDFNISTGGNACNVAINLAKMGVIVDYFGGAIGVDMNGKLMLSQLMKHNIPCDGIKVLKNEKTGASIVNIASNRDKRIYQYIGANRKYNLEGKELEVFTGMNYVIISGFLLMDKLIENLEQLLYICSRNNVVIIGGLTAINDSKLKYKCRRIFKYFDFLFLNDLEAEYYTEKKHIEEQALQLQNYGAKNIIITQGEKGVYILEKDKEIIDLCALPVNVIDTTGAGDAFMSGFVYGLLHDETMIKCAELGLFTASKCIETVTSSNGLDNINLQACLH